MTLIMACLLVTIGVFAGICLHLSARLDDANGRITLFEIKIDYLERSEKTIRESVNLQTKCIRDLNDIVKKSVEGKEPTKPDTKALLSGWTTDESEPLPQLISKEEWMQLVKANLNCQRIDPLLQQCIYPLQTGQLQASAMLPPQQCIYPWQQTPLGVNLPLWYINRRLEDI